LRNSHSSGSRQAQHCGIMLVAGAACVSIGSGSAVLLCCSACLLGMRNKGIELHMPMVADEICWPTASPFCVDPLLVLKLMQYKSACGCVCAVSCYSTVMALHMSHTAHLVRLPACWSNRLLRSALTSHTPTRVTSGPLVVYCMSCVP
jgi:hypothetical protein